MSMNTSPLGTSALQVTLGGNNGLMGTDLRTDGLGLLSQPGAGRGERSQ